MSPVIRNTLPGYHPGMVLRGTFVPPGRNDSTLDHRCNCAHLPGVITVGQAAGLGIPNSGTRPGYPGYRCPGSRYR
eukprot:589567-Rhodomonas_salina.1